MAIPQFESRSCYVPVSNAKFHERENFVHVTLVFFISVTPTTHFSTFLRKDRIFAFYFTIIIYFTSNWDYILFTLPISYTRYCMWYTISGI